LSGANLSQALDYLIQLHLNQKVKIKNGALSTTAPRDSASGWRR